MTKNKKHLDEENLEMNEEGNPQEVSEEVESADEKVDVDALNAENKKLKEDYLRAYAELENTKKRCQQEIEKNNKYAISSFAKDLLAVADNLQRAIDASNGDDVCKGLLDGVKLTQNDLTKVFNKFDIHKMEVIGTVFNPNFHRVIQEVEDKTKPVGTIVAEVQTGYMIHDRILREAMVVVTKA